jgi:hypothetical protein
MHAVTSPTGAFMVPLDDMVQEHDHEMVQHLQLRMDSMACQVKGLKDRLEKLEAAKRVKKNRTCCIT